MRHDQTSRARQGFTMIEVIMAVAIFTLCAVATMHAMLAGHRQLALAESEHTGARSGERLLETLLQSQSEAAILALNGQYEPPGALVNALGEPAPDDDQASSRLVEVEHQIIPVSFGDVSAIRGLRLTVSIENEQMRVSDVSRFIPIENLR